MENYKEDIENAIDSVPNSFNNIVERNDFGQGEQILEELKKLSKKFNLEDQYNNKLKIKNHLCLEWFESDFIRFNFPQHGNYIEEIIILDKELDFIKDHKTKLKIQLLGGSIIFILSIDIDKDYYEQHLPKFFGHFNFLNSENKLMYCIFYGNVYTEGVQILTAELSFEKFGQNLEYFDMKLNVIKNYYK